MAGLEVLDLQLGALNGGAGGADPLPSAGRYGLCFPTLRTNLSRKKKKKRKAKIRVLLYYLKTNK